MGMGLQTRGAPQGQRSIPPRRWSLPRWALMLVLLFAAGLLFAIPDSEPPQTVPAHRKEVRFWHFWGGRDRPVVEGIVQRFNDSQDRYFVRAIAMPGQNLDLKFFLTVAGGDPPDLMNQDDPVVADWAHRGALTPIAELATGEELAALGEWLLPAARALGSYDGQLYALCNGLDIRALYCNQTLLQEHGLQPPRTIEDLDRIANVIAPPSDPPGRKRMGFLPDPRRLWAWGVVFGGRFADPSVAEPRAVVRCDEEPIVRALEWMTSYSRRYGPTEVTAFRSGDQALTGAAFPLLQQRRYAVIMDGQWRVRDIEEASRGRRAGDPPLDQFTAVPLPPPSGGRSHAGWVNGNFFVVPRGAKHPQGAWEFMKFWSGFGGHELQAAEACAAGGWIPASHQVIRQPAYQQLLARQPLLQTFVGLAESENQIPTPSLPVASMYYQEVVSAAEDAMYQGADPRARLQLAADRIRARLKEVLDARR